MHWFLYVLLAIVGALAALRFYIKYVKRNGSYTCLIGKTAIITGANTGLGYATALDFAMRGARVILACRNKEKAEAAVNKIIAETGNQNVLYKLLDASSLQSVRDFASDINATEERLDILMNNAGTIMQNEDYTKDLIQTVLQVNHVSGFLLTHLLLDKLRKSAPSRVVNISSFSARMSRITADNLEELNSICGGFMAMYNNSKLCNILFTTELARRLDGTGVTVNAVHPGAVYTDVMDEQHSAVKFLYNICAKYFYQTPEEGAQTQIYVSVSRDLANVSGGLFYNCRQVDIYANCKDPVLARRVWAKSEEWARIEDKEKISYEIDI